MPMFRSVTCFQNSLLLKERKMKTQEQTCNAQMLIKFLEKIKFRENKADSKTGQFVEYSLLRENRAQERSSWSLQTSCLSNETKRITTKERLFPSPLSLHLDQEGSSRAKERERERDVIYSLQAVFRSTTRILLSLSCRVYFIPFSSVLSVQNQ